MICELSSQQSLCLRTPAACLSPRGSKIGAVNLDLAGIYRLQAGRATQLIPLSQDKMVTDCRFLNSNNNNNNNAPQLPS